MTLRLMDSSPKFWGENLPGWMIYLARLASLFLMLTGLLYWIDILGVFGQSGILKGDWKMASMIVVLACSFLIASIGVWQLTFWGVVMWLASAILQTSAISLYEYFIPFEILLMLSHLIAMIGLAACGSWIYLKARKEKEE